MTRVIAVCSFLIIAMSIVGREDMSDAQDGNDFYCAMVAQWDKDAESGISPEHRAGWPPYDGRKQCKTKE